MKRLPSLDSLRVFEAAARHLSLTKASEELHVTQSALSHRIRALEEELGQELFRRYTRRVELTPAGEKLAFAMQRALAEIRRGIAEISEAPRSQKINVSALPSFATRWLVPRLSRFKVRQPDIEVRVSADPAHADLYSRAADLAIRYGTGRYQGLHVVALMDEATFPVCSPKLLAEHGPIERPEDLVHFTLLHDEVTERDGSGADWRSWCQTVGAPDMPCTEGPRFNQALLVLEAAAAGLGVALGRRSLVGGDLATGRLVRMLPHEAPTAFAYFIVCLPERAEEPAIAAFRGWLTDEAAAPA